MTALMVGLGHRPVAFRQIPANWSRRGIGLSDAPPLAPALSSKLSYTNTFYHEFPRVDLTEPPKDLVGQLEFVICSDVLEHVPPPIELALQGLFACLRPGGFAVVTVPVFGEKTLEYYPRLRSFELREDDERGREVHWTDADGVSHVDGNPEMHGGSGLTLAFRLFSPQDITDKLLATGFATVCELEAAPELGVPEITGAGIFIARKLAQT